MFPSAYRIHLYAEYNVQNGACFLSCTFCNTLYQTRRRYNPLWDFQKSARQPAGVPLNVEAKHSFLLYLSGALSETSIQCFSQHDL